MELSSFGTDHPPNLGTDDSVRKEEEANENVGNLLSLLEPKLNNEGAAVVSFGGETLSNIKAG